MFNMATSFNQNIGNWNTANVENMKSMFSGAILFNEPIGNWNTVKVSNMSYMFFRAQSFNQSIGNWNTQSVTNMDSMFYGATSFNQNLNGWNTSNVTNMSFMFERATSFNQGINNWNLSSVQFMSSMFAEATSFNQPLNTWNTSNVLFMDSMFKGAISFNQNIGNWNVSKVHTMQSMFENATQFNQNLGNWNLKDSHSNSDYRAIAKMFLNSGMDCYNYSSTLIGWANNPEMPNDWVGLEEVGMNDGSNRQYGSNAVSARDFLITTKGWGSIAGDEEVSGNCGTLSVTDVENIIKISLSPNPSTGKFIIHTNEELKITVYNVLGKQVYCTTTTQHQNEMDLTSLEKGVYFVHCQNLKNQSQNVKIIIE